jgi:hypothetical protein
MRFFSFVSRPWWQRAWLALFVKSGAVNKAGVSQFDSGATARRSVLLWDMAHALEGLGVVALLIGGYLCAVAWAIDEIDKQTGYDWAFRASSVRSGFGLKICGMVS